MSEVNSCSMVLSTCHANCKDFHAYPGTQPKVGLPNSNPTNTRGLSLRLGENQVRCFRGLRVGEID